ncbi:hypothetical protein ISS30_02300 [bacterium]|nr:hypothetical protein [FCB group bacterium]MBL7190499.1 hypothetical protein [bacterium]
MNNSLKTSVIYCGDCLNQLKKLPENFIDLIYIDPPFNSNRNYEVFWGDTKEKRAFEDRFGAAEHYVNWMTPRLVQLVRVLKPTGSFYYHCDWHASHYIKIKLDQMFGFNNMQNELIWYYPGNSAPKYCFPRKHDTIFFYTKSKKFTFTGSGLYVPYSEATLRRYNHIDEEGRRYKISSLRSHKKEKVYAKPGKPVQDVWEFSIVRKKEERLGFPTQKPLKLLDRIIKASSNPDDVILDAFCGCGTTLVAAQQLGRKWIGIDISPTACRVMAKRLKDVCGLKEGRDFVVRDLPKTWNELKKYPPFEFQNWAVNALGGIPSAAKVGDMGIDGYIYPVDDVSLRKEEGKDLFGEMDKRIPVQVKQHKAGRPDIDNFETAMRRDHRTLGFFVALEYTKDAVREIERANNEEGLKIIHFTVQQILDEEAKVNSYI